MPSILMYQDANTKVRYSVRFSEEGGVEITPLIVKEWLS